MKDTLLDQLTWLSFTIYGSQVYVNRILPVGRGQEQETGLVWEEKLGKIRKRRKKLQALEDSLQRACWDRNKQDPTFPKLERGNFVGLQSPISTVSGVSLSSSACLLAVRSRLISYVVAGMHSGATRNPPRQLPQKGLISFTREWGPYDVLLDHTHISHPGRFRLLRHSFRRLLTQGNFALSSHYHSSICPGIPAGEA